MEVNLFEGRERIFRFVRGVMFCQSGVQLVVGSLFSRFSFDLDGCTFISVILFLPNQSSSSAIKSSRFSISYSP